MEILDVMWFCAGHGNCGIVRVEDEYDGIKYYVGACPGEEKGHNEEEDKQWIANWGSRFPKHVGDALFGQDDVHNQTAVPLPRSKEYAEHMVRVGQYYLEHNK